MKRILVILTLLLMTGNASAWLSSYDYRMPIEINNTGNNLTHYQYNFTIDTASLVAAGKMNANGSDCRITDDVDGLLYWWNETPFNLSNTKIWINATSLENVSNTTHYFYYGNSSASTVSDGDATFPFFADSHPTCWTNLSVPPFPKADIASAVIGDTVYIIGGYNNTSNDPRPEMWAYNTTNDSYDQKASLTYARWGLAAAELDGKIYTFGGSPTANGSKCEMYTPETNSWSTQSTAVPAAIYDQGLTAVSDGTFIYLFRGNNLYKYNATADSYTLLNNTPPNNVTNWPVMAYKDDIIYIIGGYYSGAKDYVMIYNITSDLWSSGTSMPVAIFGALRENPIVDDKIYVIQGQSTYGEFFSRFWTYNITADSWETGKLGYFEADGVSGGVIESKIYTFCGRRDTTGPYGTKHAAVLDTTKELIPDWINVASANWRISPDGLTSGHLQPNTNGQLRSSYTTSDNSIRVVGKLKYLSGSTGYGGLCTYTNTGLYASTLNGYLNPYVDIGGSADVIYRETGSDFLSLGSIALASADTWHTYTLNHNATHLILLRNGTQEIVASDNTYRSGYVQILKKDVMDLYVNFVFVSDFVDAEPTTSLGAEEGAPSGGAPSITSYAPTGTIWPEVSDSQSFNVTTDQTTNCTWYINGTQVQYNTSATEHTYTNTSLVGGHWNVTAIANNTNGTDSQTWLFEVGADSITYIVLQDTPTNQSMIMKWNVTRIGSNVTDWGIWLNYTFSGWTYYFRYTNGTEIMNQTASSNNESLWFNGTSLLPVGVYFINATSNTNIIVLGTNKYGMLRKSVTSAQSFSTIASEFSHDVCFTWWDSTNDRWESYYSGDSYNSAKSVPQNDSYFVLMDGIGETVSCSVAAAENVDIPIGWSSTYLRESTSKTLSAIKADMGANVTDLYAWNHTASGTGAWTNTGTFSVLPNQGILVDASSGFAWDGSVS